MTTITQSIGNGKRRPEGESGGHRREGGADPSVDSAGAAGRE
jgi:hypothetical protein